MGWRLNELLVKIREGECERGLIQGVTAFDLKELKITTKIISKIIIAFLQADTKTQKNLKKDFILTPHRFILNLIGKLLYLGYHQTLQYQNLAKEDTLNKSTVSFFLRFLY